MEAETVIVRIKSHRGHKYLRSVYGDCGPTYHTNLSSVVAGGYYHILDAVRYQAAREQSQHVRKGTGIAKVPRKELMECWNF